MINNLPPALFVADAPALDFINSRAMPTGEVVDWLRDGEDFLAWLEQAKLAPREVIAKLRGEARPAEIDAVARKARSLRDWFRGFIVAHMGRPLTSKAAGELEPLNRILADDGQFHQIVPQRGSARTRGGESPPLSWQLKRNWHGLESLLLPIAETMGEFVCTADFSRVKPCEGTHCTILFLDRTRSGARRWCSMAVCGNRAKQATHRARARDG
ncbi:MAG: CGNR zinc finger domain-containing protein [Methylovirgula sp.]|nr:CGNR zinc finger domain-containing protein [Methylovirgula sp.]